MYSCVGFDLDQRHLVAALLILSRITLTSVILTLLRSCGCQLIESMGRLRSPGPPERASLETDDDTYETPFRSNLPPKRQWRCHQPHHVSPSIRYFIATSLLISTPSPGLSESWM